MGRGAKRALIRALAVMVTRTNWYKGNLRTAKYDKKAVFYEIYAALNDVIIVKKGLYSQLATSTVHSVTCYMYD